MNVHDSENISAIMEEMGYSKKEDMDEADVIILNTCAIRENAHNKVHGMLGRIKHLKETKEDVITVFCGCMAQEEGIANELKEKFDYILIDCPAGIEQGFKNAIAGANRAIVVTTAEISSIRDADRIIGLLESSEIKNPELVINRIRPNMVRRGEMMDVDDIVDLLSIDLIGVVPDDEYIITQTNKGEPVIQNRKAPSGKAYLEIAKRVLGENIEVTIPGREKGFFSRIKSIFKK